MPSIETADITQCSVPKQVVSFSPAKYGWLDAAEPRHLNPPARNDRMPMYDPLKIMSNTDNLQSQSLLSCNAEAYCRDLKYGQTCKNKPVLARLLLVLNESNVTYQGPWERQEDLSLQKNSRGIVHTANIEQSSAKSSKKM